MVPVYTQITQEVENQTRQSSVTPDLQEYGHRKQNLLVSDVNVSKTL